MLAFGHHNANGGVRLDLHLDKVASLTVGYRPLNPLTQMPWTDCQPLSNHLRESKHIPQAQAV